MSYSSLSRKEFLIGSGTTAAGLALTGAGKILDGSKQEERYHNGRSPWPISLDTATIRPASTIEEKIRIAAEAGYDAIEPWEGELNEYEQNGGDLRELGEQIRDLGLDVPNVVALWNAIPPTQAGWDSMQEDHRRRFRQTMEIGATYIQTVLTPAREWHEYNLDWAAARYRDLLEMGIEEYNVLPALNFLQFLPHNQRIGQASAIALNADHPQAKIIPDTFHMYVGGSGWNGLQHIQGHFIAIFQINDVPDSPPREELEDEHRVYPGDGIFPLPRILRDLKGTGYKDFISLQLFNPVYWEQDLLEVARTGLEKTLAVIEEAGV
ncbi:MAG: sugar phosphate isomerase/epimerase [Balneolaceae bacterium]